MQDQDSASRSPNDRTRDVQGVSPELPAGSFDTWADSQVGTEPEDGNFADPIGLPATEAGSRADSLIDTEPEPAAGTGVGEGRGPGGPDDVRNDPRRESSQTREERCRLDQGSSTESFLAPDPNLVGAGPERIHGPEGVGAPTLAPFIGRYRVIRVLGRGAFGIVYLSHDADLDREVAIKVPVDGPSSLSLDVESYLEEARTLARLSHPNIVPVYDVGHIPGGRCYVVSKYMEGGDLAARLRQARPAFVESAELIAILCEALHYTHAHDLFHRDIKPANILLDAAGVPYLADFGLALKDEDVGKGGRHRGHGGLHEPGAGAGRGPSR